MIQPSPLWKRVIGATLVAGALGFLYLIHHVLAPFLIAMLIVYLLDPLVGRLSQASIGRWSLGRKGAVAIVFTGFFTLVTVAGIFLVPHLYQEGARIARELPQFVRTFEHQTMPAWMDRIQAVFDTYGVDVDARRNLKEAIASFLHTGEGQTAAFAKQAQGVVKGVFSTIFSVVLVFMLTAFLLLDWPNIKTRLVNVIPEAYRPTIVSIGRDIDRGLAGAIRGQLLVCLINGVLTTVGLLLLKVKYAVTIGIIAGFFSLIPIFGTVISTIPAVLIGLTQSVMTAVSIVLMICLIHLIEANFLNPKVLGHNAEIHPVVVLFALLVGEHYFGAIGLLLAVPTAAIARAVLTFVYRLLVTPSPLPEPAPQTVQGTVAPVAAAETVTP